jgi:hypothetical protein
LDEDFGAEAAAAAAAGPIWLRASPNNKSAAAGLWSASGLSDDHVTTFDPPPGCSAEEASLYILDTVIQHHPTWTSMAFIGVPAFPALKRELASYAAGSVHATERGFIFSREPAET